MGLGVGDGVTDFRVVIPRKESQTHKRRTPTRMCGVKVSMPGGDGETASIGFRVPDFDFPAHPLPLSETVGGTLVDSHRIYWVLRTPDRLLYESGFSLQWTCPSGSLPDSSRSDPRVPSRGDRLRPRPGPVRNGSLEPTRTLWFVDDPFHPSTVSRKGPSDWV